MQGSKRRKGAKQGKAVPIPIPSFLCLSFRALYNYSMKPVPFLRPLCLFHSPLQCANQCATLAKGLSERVQSRGEFMREVSLLNEGEFKGFFDREMHALLWLSLRSLPTKFKMSLSASLSATSLIGIGQAPSLIDYHEKEKVQRGIYSLEFLKKFGWSSDM
ncbi:uncharacterized protein LOC111298273 [Durio zibethinus]|uniref:Uncharacterized protein LOC111298273 n=1 Tax=Durio zibethinus TaxID=66656 RepID=A0A6P5Z7P9_DURZI|nr:uncharacterized protein LOC111298273 [Durio zibethinus]